MQGFYYLILWKGYPKEKNTWELSLAVIDLQKFIKTFYKEYQEKQTVTCLYLDSVPPMVRSIVLKKQQPKQKRGHLIKGANKKSRNYGIRNSDAFFFPRCGYRVKVFKLKLLNSFFLSSISIRFSSPFF